MVKKLIPVILIIFGLGAGMGAGMMLRPAPDPANETAEMAMDEAEPEVQPDYVKMTNQFVIPVVEEGDVTAMVLLSLSLEVVAGSTDAVYAREPKLRDGFLQVLFDHANNGGFRGAFTDGPNLVLLREALREVATKEMPEVVRDVLIVDLVRQET